MAARRYEEMGSTYPRGGLDSDSSSRSSPDSLNGLKFGHKIYFGDVAFGSSSAAAAATPGKKGRGPVQTGQPPRCQVQGCDLDLTDAKAYYSRHKVCSMHSKYSTVIVGGIQQRFCQQCSRFHQLAEFDNEKRSCRRRLAGHNERRRKPPPGSLLSSRTSRSVFDGGSSSSGTGFLVDFSASLKGPEQSSWPGTKSRANQGVWPGGPHPGEMYLHGSASGLGTTTTATTYQVGPSIPSGECFAGVTDSRCALSLLSNQGWSSLNRAPPTPPPPPPPPHCDHFPGSPWGYKVEEPSHDLPHHPLSSRAAGDELDMAQPGGRQLVEYEHSGSYGSSSDHMNWLL